MSTIPTFPPGWKVFPVKAGTKEPQFYAWPKEATDDPAQIESWHIQYPDCNWGLACGPSGLAVVDIDPPIGEDSLFQFEMERELLPKTREHTSARGGRHLIYRGDIKPTISVLGPNLDTRGGNSYILIPPSTFEGKPYVVTQDIPLAEIPTFVVDAAGASYQHASASDGMVLDAGNAKIRATTRIADLIKQGKIAREATNDGDATTYAVAAEIQNLGLSPEATLEVMLPWNELCEPPWTIEGLRGKIANASRYAQNDAGAWYVPPVSERIPAKVLDKLFAENVAAQPVPGQGERSRFKWLNEDQLKNIPPAEWLIKDKLMRDSTGMIYGPSGSYKSFLMMGLAAQVAQQGGLAFYVASEGLRRIAHKDLPAWKLANGENNPIPIRFIKDMPMLADDFDVKAFIKSIAEKAKEENKRVDLVVLDTLNRALLGLEENSASDMSRVVMIMDAIKDAFHCAVIAVHHTPKSGTDPRGSGALYAAFDTVIKVISQTETKLAQMFVIKQRDEEVSGRPFSFQGKQFGPGMAFVPIEDKDAAILKNETDRFTSTKIGAALVALKAWKPVTVSSHVLAAHMTPELINENPEDRAASVALTLTALKGAVKKKDLGGYYEVRGRELVWSLDAPETQDQ